MDYINQGAIPPLIQSDAVFSNVLTSSPAKLSEMLGPVLFKNSVTIESTNPVVISDTLIVSALTVSGTTKLGTAASASVSIGTTSATLIGFYGHSAVLQPTAASSATTSGLVTGTVSNCVSSSTTFDNYTLAQFVTAVRATGLIA